MYTSLKAHTPLLEMGLVDYCPSGLSCLSQRGQKNTHQKGNNRNDGAGHTKTFFVSNKHQTSRIVNFSYLPRTSFFQSETTSFLLKN